MFECINTPSPSPLFSPVSEAVNEIWGEEGAYWAHLSSLERLLEPWKTNQGARKVYTIAFVFLYIYLQFCTDIQQG